MAYLAAYAMVLNWVTKKCSHQHQPWLSVMVWTDFKLQFLSLHWDVPQISGCVASRLRGQRSACGHAVVCLVRLRATKRCRDTDFHPIDLPLCRGWRSDEGVNCDVMFYGVTWWSARPLTSAWSQRRKQTYALFQWALTHKGQLVVFQFIKWIWTLALWSRLVSTDVKSHPSQTKATRRENPGLISRSAQVFWPFSQSWV